MQDSSKPCAGSITINPLEKSDKRRRGAVINACFNAWNAPSAFDVQVKEEPFKRAVRDAV
jgi:hypothetical protein